MKLKHLIASIEAEGGKAPEWMLLFAAGWGTLADGARYLVDQAALGMISDLIEARGNEVHWDYEHASIQDKAKLANGAPAAGWIKELKWEPARGILARVEWTEKAAAHIAAKEYRYFSPVFAVSKQDSRVCYLDSVALTNRPKTNNLTPILASLEARLGNLFKEDLMDLKKLIAALGLPDDADMTTIVAALAKIGVTFPENKKTVEVIPASITSALGLETTDGESVVVACIHALNQTKANGVSIEEFNALQKKFTDREASDVVATAMAAGKVTPDQKDWAKTYAQNDLEGFKTFVAKAPVVVPVGKLPGKTEKNGKPGELTDTDLQVASQMDMDPEDVKTFGLEVKHG